MPAALQSSISFFRIGREAPEMSVSPLQNFLNPPPVPEIPTVTLIVFFFDFWNSSATASVMGKTVLEPSILTIWACAENEQAAAATPSTAPSVRKRAFIRAPLIGVVGAQCTSGT